MIREEGEEQLGALLRQDGFSADSMGLSQWHCCLQMEKRAAQAAEGGVQSRVQLVRASPQRAALRLAEEHVALEPASISIQFKPLARSQALLRRG